MEGIYLNPDDVSHILYAVTRCGFDERKRAEFARLRGDKKAKAIEKRSQYYEALASLFSSMAERGMIIIAK